MQNELDLAVFVEQAEYISPDDFGKWVVEHPQEESIIRKLISPGAKLITGPRGCGKTTLLLKALHKSREKSVLAIYINFKTSLKMEPLYKKNVNAPYWFLQWMLLKVYDGLHNTMNDVGLASKEISISRTRAEQSLRLIEDGLIEKIPEESNVSLDQLQKEIDNLLKAHTLARCVILLDDAAHAFSTEQQEDFFDFFRKIKSRTISPKAAIYPGVTTFSPSFHVGHDAEEISVWLNPAKENYVTFMENLLRKRLPPDVVSGLISSDNLLKLLIYAANGIPRHFLNMINSIIFDEEDSYSNTSAPRLNRQATLRAIESNFNDARLLYTSLKSKLPIYKSFIEQGDIFFDRILDIVKEFNKGGEIDKQATLIGIKNPIEAEVSKVIGFFEYAGLLCPAGDSKRGSKGVYELFALNYSAIVNRNVFFSSRSLNPQNYVAAFEARPNHVYPRVTTETIFDTKEVSSFFELSLPPCQKCKEPRVNENARFCIKCGAELTSISVFEGIVAQDITVLPLTDRRITAIKAHSKIRTIKDILMDHDRRQLRSVPMIGEIWAKRIARYAEEQFA